MTNVLQIPNRSDQLPAPIWTPQCAQSALADNSFSIGGWKGDYAVNALRDFDCAKQLAELRRGLLPAPQAWLANRLEALWNSHPHAGSIRAMDWLMETGRLLADLPFDILGDAIDQAVKDALSGFMPGVGEIRAIGEPKVKARRLMEERLVWVMKQHSGAAEAAGGDQRFRKAATVLTFDQAEQSAKSGTITQIQIDALPDQWKEILDCRNILRRQSDGTFKLRTCLKKVGC